MDDTLVSTMEVLKNLLKELHGDHWPIVVRQDRSCNYEGVKVWVEGKEGGWPGRLVISGPRENYLVDFLVHG